MWKYKLCGADTQVCNGPCIVKKIILFYAGITTALIYNQVKGDDALDADKRVWTLNSTAAIPKDEIDFGIQGADFYEGCYIDHALGEVLVVYKH